MKFSLNFVKEFIDLKITPEKLCELITSAGIEVEQYEKIENDWVFDVEVTSNRYDWLSHIGIAREIAAVSGIPVKVKYPKIITTPALKHKKIIIKNESDCPLYIGRRIAGVKVEKSPAWLRERVEHCGVSSVNNIVDITNYCMLKWGNPLHAFDYDKIEGDIYVRRAKKGEPFLGLDGKERELVPENLVIADHKKVIALAGVIGAKNTEVDEHTKNILLEAAIFSPVVTRRSRRLTVETDSSYRFERRVCPEYVEIASSHANELIHSFANGTFSGYAYAGKKPKERKKKIPLYFGHLEHYIGSAIPQKEIKTILTHLGFSLGASSKTKLDVNVPPFRLDVDQAVDLYEEIARVYGYDKIPSSLPSIKNRMPVGLYDFKKSLRDFLISMGLQETVTFSITSQELMERLQQGEGINLINPLRVQENMMRTTLLTGALDVIKHNLNQQTHNLEFFEIADIYKKQKDGFKETPSLAIAMSGGPEKACRLKGMIELLIKWLNIDMTGFEPDARAHFTNALKVSVEKKEIGFFGKLDKKTRDGFDIKEDIFFCEIDMAKLAGIKKDKKMKTFGRYPAVTRDISLAVHTDTLFKDIEEIITAHAGGYLQKIEVVDTYRGENIEKGYYGLTVRISYQSQEKTLTSDEVDALHGKIRQAITDRPGVQLR
ncbi:MAG: phenylalanine--tRNA ligase subunit beta [Candidatus Omnitrophica bacterium]|nr:phenylalanine--tRNA ligase subunit beta [Candidatus Omnitrophota bacterium]